MIKLQNYLGEIVYAGIDGSVTTFAVVAGASGASIDTSVIIILGFANLIADGFSMSVGNYLSNKAELDSYYKSKSREYWEIEHLADSEKQEIREIYKVKGFEGDLLEKIVEVITANKERWVDEMMKNELEMIPKNKPPVLMSLVTYLSFITIGLIPLSVYLLDYFISLHANLFLISSLLTTAAFVSIGWMKSFVTDTSKFRGVSETLILGIIAAVLAYAAGDILKFLFI